jgi:SP family general alpha glucoside:H+ symporter-like MFS transporter
MFLLMLAIGSCGLLPASNNASRWAIGSLLVVFIFIYQSTVGPITYCLVAEIPSSRLRQKSVALARNVFNISSIVCNILTTQQLNVSAWNWGARAGFFWAGSIALCLTWVFFRLPESTGRSFAELDLLFERRVSARTFASVSSQELADSAMAHGRRMGKIDEVVYLEKL